MLFKISGLIFFLWAIFIISLYYTKNSSHLGLINGTPFSVILIYCLILGIFYGIFKYFSYKKETNQVETTWNLWQIFGGFLAVLFILCVFYTVLEPTMSSGASLWTTPNAFVLFFHIVQFLIYPIFLVFLWKAIGSSILHFFADFKNFSLKIRTPIETAIGMLVFVFGIFVLGFFGIFTLTNLIILLTTLTIASFLGWKNIFHEIKNHKITISRPQISSHVITAEIGFLLFCTIISISFLNILRPMPIGWDDLGVYMNFPRIIANFGGLLEGSAMYAWQLVTATGFLFNNNATQAFFINQIGGIVATVAMIGFFSLFLENKKSKHIIALPILLGIVYYVMPMTIFHQAKDMKLDPALLFVSSTAFVTLFYAVKNFFTKNFKNAFFLFFIAGVLTGFAFSIKFTTLILIISTFSYISYTLLGFAGLIGFSGLFIAIFTKLGLWSHLFVWMPENTQNIVIFSLLVGIAGFGIAFRFFKENFIKYLQFLCIFALGMILSVSPWILKNFSELGENISISGLLSGASKKTWSEGSIFYADYDKIFTKDEYEKRISNNNNATTNADGVSLNEDFARYFGQETGLNNYLKLPTNLTLQNNQKWEFTDITYIFLAFVPVVLLFFVNFSHGNKKKIFFGGMIFFLILWILSVIISLPSENFLQKFFTSLFSQITLPMGYIVLLALVFGFLELIHFTISNAKIRGILVFLAIYGLVFWVSAFGIVWYGVLIYFLFLLVISLGANEFNTLNDNEAEDVKFFKKIFSYGFFALLGLYLFVSTPLHAFSNMQNAGYSEYKYYNLSQNSAIFANKWDYFKPLVELNLENSEDITKTTLEKLQKSAVGKIFEAEKNKNIPSLEAIHEWFTQKIHEAMSLGYQKNLYKQSADEHIANISANKNISHSQKNTDIQKIRTNLANIEKEVNARIRTLNEQIRVADPIMNELYSEVLSPKHENKNRTGIYRVGTFFTYFVQNNRSRFYEDSLLTNFQTFFYDENPEISAEKLKKIGLSYVLLDLNAATIDSEEANISARETGRASLTTRYENILTTLRDEKFSLIHTDNICLRLAIDEYKKWKLTSREEFLNIAGTNYTHYEKKNNILTAVSRGQIAQNCAEYINDLANKKDRSYTYLSPIFEAKTQDEYINTITQLTGKQSYFALFKINE